MLLPPDMPGYKFENNPLILPIGADVAKVESLMELVNRVSLPKGMPSFGTIEEQLFFLAGHEQHERWKPADLDWVRDTVVQQGLYTGEKRARMIAHFQAAYQQGYDFTPEPDF